MSMSLAFGPVSRFITPSLYRVMESRQAWCELLQLSQEAKAELDFWSSSLESYNAQPIWHSPSAVRVIYSDASETGYGGYVVEHGPCVSHGCWMNYVTTHSLSNGSYHVLPVLIPHHTITRSIFPV